MKTVKSLLTVILICLIFVNGCGSGDGQTGRNPENSSSLRVSGSSSKDKETASSKGSELRKLVEEKRNGEDLPEKTDIVQNSSLYDPEKREEIISESEGFYNKLNQGEDVNILINGDSIGAGAGSKDGSSWTDLLKNYIEEKYSVSCNMTNISLGGNSSYAGYVMENMPDLKPSYDLMIICYGENDSDKHIAADYEAMIRSALKRYPSLNMISILESSQREYTKKMEKIMELSEYYDIRVADTIAAFNESGRDYDDLTVDIKHPNDEGYRLYFETVKEVIDRECNNDTGVEKIERMPLLNEVEDYNNIRIFKAEEFVRSNEKTYVLPLNETIGGVIGLYHLYCPSNGEILIRSNGKEVIRRSMVWANDFDQYFIYRADNNTHSISKDLEITFPTAEMADGFKGFIISYK